MYTPEEMEIIHQEVIRLQREEKKGTTGSEQLAATVQTETWSKSKEIKFAVFFFGGIIALSSIVAYLVMQFSMETIVSAMYYGSIVASMIGGFLYLAFSKYIPDIFVVPAIVVLLMLIINVAASKILMTLVSQ